MEKSRSKQQHDLACDQVKTGLAMIEEKTNIIEFGEWLRNNTAIDGVPATQFTTEHLYEIYKKG